MKYGHPYYTDDETAPPEVLERLANEHPTLVLAWNNREGVWDVLARNSDKGKWVDAYSFILTWMLPCPTCGWRRWQKVNCRRHIVKPVSIRNPGLFKRLREIRVGTTEEESDAWCDNVEAADRTRAALREKKDDESRMEGARKASVNLLRDPRLKAAPKAVKDFIEQARRRVPVSVNGLRPGG